MSDKIFSELKRIISYGSQKEIISFMDGIKEVNVVDEKLNLVMNIFSATSVGDYYESVCKSMCESYDYPEVIATLYECAKWLPNDEKFNCTRLMREVIAEAIHIKTNKNVYNKWLRLYCGYNDEDIYRHYLFVALKSRDEKFVGILYKIIRETKYLENVVSDIMLDGDINCLTAIDMFELFFPIPTVEEKLHLKARIQDRLVGRFDNHWLKNIQRIDCYVIRCFMDWMKKQFSAWRVESILGEQFAIVCKKGDYFLMEYYIKEMRIDPYKNWLYRHEHSAMSFALAHQSVDVVQYLLGNGGKYEDFAANHEIVYKDLERLIQKGYYDKVIVLVLYDNKLFHSVPHHIWYRIDHVDNFWIFLNARNKNLSLNVFKDYFSEVTYDQRLNRVRSILSGYVAKVITGMIIAYI
ncbi:MAG: hypothetical protein Hyperionvirus2_197 [Hyperionvirus sp.]|uniref:Uncharacterized protein n=1 Tax=Hyperionvirus sp. TaxID=2487770 RepID=A0A3G5AC18_9VIRU|nr:MAG: hypothetical protein Hyperionvirus2_197 [Hyperionvirus sp.]